MCERGNVRRGVRKRGTDRERKCGRACDKRASEPCRRCCALGQSASFLSGALCYDNTSPSAGSRSGAFMSPPVSNKNGHWLSGFANRLGGDESERTFCLRTVATFVSRGDQVAPCIRGVRRRARKAQMKPAGADADCSRQTRRPAEGVWMGTRGRRAIFVFYYDCPRLGWCWKEGYCKAQTF